MPLGYTVGKMYRFDEEYDRFAALDVWKRLHREAGKRGYSTKVSFSHITRGYCAEAISAVKFKKSANWYFSNEAMKYAPDPLSACVAAYRECVPADDLMSVLYLEAECVLLGIALADALKREAREAAVMAKLENAIDLLADCISLFLPPCGTCGGSGFVGPESGYDGVCSNCGGMKTEPPGWFCEKAEKTFNTHDAVMAKLEGVLDGLAMILPAVWDRSGILDLHIRELVHIFPGIRIEAVRKPSTGRPAVYDEDDDL